MSMESIEKLRQIVKTVAARRDVFNPWWEADKQNDVGPQRARHPKKQLAAYLRKRLGMVRLVVIGEALGYRGAGISAESR